MSMNVFCPRPPRAAVPHYLIVARGHAGVYQVIREIVQGEFTVLVDRRQAERRRGEQLVLEERRRGKRRTLQMIAVRSRCWQLCWPAQVFTRRTTDRRAVGAG